jgi:LemA protein
MVAVYVILGLVALAVLIGILIYNGLIGARNRVDEAWSGIDVQLKRRHDLVPNLVEAVKGYAAHEAGVLEAVTAARSAAVAASGPAAQGAAEAQLSRAIAPINALAEQYPQLRASENFQQLQAQLSQLEDEIQASRRLYNGNVQRYQTKKQQFPSSIVAGMGDFPDKELFALEDRADREVPTVSFR